MATFLIENFGCRATEADAAALRRQFLAGSLTPADSPTSADVVVLNTCTVTAAADSQARDTVRKIHRANPAACIVVTGCYAQRAPEEIAAIPGVAWVVGNSHQAEIPRLIREMVAPSMAPAACTQTNDFVPLALLERTQLEGSRLEVQSLSIAPERAKVLIGDIFAENTMHIAAAGPVMHDRTRPILKIQDGCNNRCSFCVIPFVRGSSRSLPPNAVVDEVRNLVAAGAQEIVLSGINLGSYGRDLAPRARLEKVTRRILAETDLAQLRFSSIEPQDITEDFVALVASSDRIAQHFHVPLQSGSDRTLRAMHRWYRAEHYAQRVNLIRRMLPNAAIGADVIVGFPGETEEDFQATSELIEDLPFTYLHVFSFSARPGTKAASMDAIVPENIIHSRARALRALAQTKSAEFRASQAGQSLRALTLARAGDNWTEAITGNYLRMRIAGCHPANEWHHVLWGAEELAAAGEPRQISSQK